MGRASKEYGDRPPQVLLIDNFLSDDELIYATNVLINETQWNKAPHESDDTNRNHYTIEAISDEIVNLDAMLKNRLHTKMESFFGDLFFIPEAYSYSRWMPGDSLGCHCDSGYSGGELMIEMHNEGQPHRPLSLHLNDVAAVTYFTDGYEGGKLFFNNIEYQIEPAAGTTIVFPATAMYEHGVTELISGERLTMTSFWPKVKTIVTSVMPKIHNDWHMLVRNPEQFYKIAPQCLMGEVEPHLLPAREQAYEK
ncbi:Oxoglutarate/iron-dependent dioxygenase [uncultured Caudovirales phage]|uniref:Oxoglutarate/iron-dependent dioxygenase n=1 Tax=uncultured Caudovirales phage TaxID=2100421 RepID=A0A6J5NHZ5_9CAUD|nr:Oxoglutarate/iron-dependent dioxygenase [uncultured Caudovirales phage]